jgi:hypothetical protein
MYDGEIEQFSTLSSYSMNSNVCYSAIDRKREEISTKSVRLRWEFELKFQIWLLQHCLALPRWQVIIKPATTARLHASPTFRYLTTYYTDSGRVREQRSQRSKWIFCWNEYTIVRKNPPRLLRVRFSNAPSISSRTAAGLLLGSISQQRSEL